MTFEINPEVRDLLKKCMRTVNFNREECFDLCEYFNPVKLNSIILTNIKNL